MAEPKTISQQLDGKKTHIGGWALVVYGVLDMLGIAPLDQTFTEGAGDIGPAISGLGATISALRAAITKLKNGIQESFGQFRTEIAALKHEVQTLRTGQSSDSEGSA